MTLTVATLLFGLLLLLKGAWFLAGPRLGGVSIAALRNRGLTAVLLVLLSTWFLLKVLQLGESDFGNYKHILFAVFLATAVGAWFYTPDFLAVRAACGLYLLLAGLFLESAFGLYEMQQRLFLVAAVYAGIATALYYAAVPYRARDSLRWLYEKALRVRVLGTVMAAYGVFLVVVSTTY